LICIESLCSKRAWESGGEYAMAMCARYLA
jgi:hypothetical protein